jgi:hypothetical protein
MHGHTGFTIRSVHRRGVPDSLLRVCDMKVTIGEFPFFVPYNLA